MSKLIFESVTEFVYQLQNGNYLVEASTRKWERNETAFVDYAKKVKTLERIKEMVRELFDWEKDEPSRLGGKIVKFTRFPVQPNGLALTEEQLGRGEEIQRGYAVVSGKIGHGTRWEESKYYPMYRTHQAGGSCSCLSDAKIFSLEEAEEVLKEEMERHKSSKDRSDCRLIEIVIVREYIV